VKGKLRRILGLYRRSRILSFVVDHSREAKRLRLQPKEAADEAHISGTWNFENATERKWQGHVLEVLASIAGEERWGNALEIGCSEGVFTEQLAQRCTSLSAYDISPVATERATKRCASYSNVQIICQDAATEAVPGQYDMVFVMDILWLVVGRDRQLSIVSKLVQNLREGGLLVFSDSRMPKVVRHPIWSALFPSGADQWARLIENTPGLEAVHREFYPPKGESVPGWWDKLFVVYRKGPAH